MNDQIIAGILIGGGTFSLIYSTARHYQRLRDAARRNLNL